MTALWTVLAAVDQGIHKPNQFDGPRAGGSWEGHFVAGAVIGAIVGFVIATFIGRDEKAFAGIGAVVGGALLAIAGT